MAIGKNSDIEVAMPTTQPGGAAEKVTAEVHARTTGAVLIYF
jgi:hypothetical protein